eukprot:CAMPEP_0204877244 /NCGR_PEP_ID=MMETSP1348-20121228/48082_1 /ASSEMBLY_ACC=CAM_ASM_000700 /TAXON_ID=215587 /ORGANISM="Aplanochytrium stocchinoi, Strain GSBS06" /LENGTH=405 /DNA_ID=CAMNT_0052034095 /DNA_START=96 /DNA_END=1310 /DNA_ORIENTATION=-
MKHRKCKVVIIGAGASGLVTAKYLLQVGNLDAKDVTIIEETDQVGGIWNRRGRPMQEQDVKVSIDGIPVKTSMQPVYEDLLTNLPSTLMAFSDMNFPISDGLFPRQERVLRYLHVYAQRNNLFNCILFNSHVSKCEKTKQDGCWRVTVDEQDLQDEILLEADRLIVCSGHFRKPFVPPVIGLKKFQGKLMHSSAFTKAADFKDEVVLIIGASTSGSEIAGILAKSKLCKDVIVSVRNLHQRYKAYLKVATENGAIICPGLQRIEDKNAILFTNGQRQYPTVILFATGYRYSFPFLDDASVSTKDSWVRKDGYKMQNLYNRLIYTKDPSLVFIGTSNLLISPFMIFEYQAHYLAKIVNGTVALPAYEEMNKEVISRSNEKGQDVLLFKCPSYCNSLAKISGFQGYW